MDSDLGYVRPTPDEDSFPADTARQRITNVDHVDSNAVEEHLRGIRRVQRTLLSLVETQAPNEESSNLPEELSQNKDTFDIKRDKRQPGKDDGKGQSSFPESGAKSNFPNESPELLTHEQQVSGLETSGLPDMETSVRPERARPLIIRWHEVYPRTKRDDNRRYKVKRKKKSKDPAKSSSPIIVAGIAAGILVLLCIVTSVFQLW